MKVLKNNYETYETKKEEITVRPYPRTHTCENCRSELEYDESDLRMGALGVVYLDCPLCGYDNMLEDNEDTITLTKNNIEFPTHFWHTSKEDGAIDCCSNEEIKKCVNRAIDYFRKNKDAFSWYTEYGNLYISVFRYDGDEDYYVMATNNYYSTYIPFENEDYKVVD